MNRARWTFLAILPLLTATLLQGTPKKSPTFYTGWSLALSGGMGWDLSSMRAQAFNGGSPSYFGLGSLSVSYEWDFFTYGVRASFGGDPSAGLRYIVYPDVFTIGNRQHGFSFIVSPIGLGFMSSKEPPSQSFALLTLLGVGFYGFLVQASIDFFDLTYYTVEIGYSISLGGSSSPAKPL